jgi:tetratricopeptide (TPR) repeat protein
MQNWMKELRSDTRLIIIHPNYRLQHKLIWQPVHEGCASYLRIEGENLSLKDVTDKVDGMQKELDSTEMEYVVLDEADRVNDEALYEFIKQFLAKKSHKLIVNSRRLSVNLLQDEELRPITQFYPVNPERLLYNYAESPANKTLLEVNSLGTGHSILNGKAITEWDGALPRLLFFFFVDKGMVTRSEIFKTFWPDVAVKEATNVFHVTKRKINEVLGFDLMVYRSGFYCISDNVQLYYDVVQFNQLFQDSEITESDEAEAMLLNAINLYRGDFLQLMNSEWVNKRRSEIRESYGEALFSLGKIYKQRNDLDRSRNYFLRAYRHNPSESEYYQAVKLWL